ncbi:MULTISPECIES: hypothetical protein [unclassified Prochlorococcus]|uniref:hypothetical protein n=1 Tax=unclassified Prochlorococcus TaxID=2627481 RepID=UPI000533A90B|nr:MULTISPECIES: hypothetical protein [unclassified Prochlorococcus]KGG15285.1 hypothetical protein EV06_1156 [Prochlorococcus sp. MIT 0602]KGG17562.1 hypothetical protein EV07_1002 [Prochlorococcus sp. MIT 0603]
MIIADICSSNSTAQKRRQNFYHRKLELLSMYRDSLERRIVAINASISKLEEQINRDQELA